MLPRLIQTNRSFGRAQFVNVNGLVYDVEVKHLPGYFANQAVYAKNPGRVAFHNANGYMPISPYMAVYSSFDKLTLGSLKYWYTNGTPSAVLTDTFNCGSETMGVGGSLVLPSSDSRISALRASAIANANSRARDQDMGLGEALAEGRQTVDMILKTVSRLTRAARHVRRHQWQRAADELGLRVIPKGVKRKNTVFDNWLAYRYGWTPLYGTVFGAVKNLAERNQAQKTLFFPYGKAEDTIVVKSTAGTYSPSSSPGAIPSVWFTAGIYWKVEKEVTHKVNYKVGYVLRKSSSLYGNQMLLNKKLGIADPFTLAWELVPLSFVVDWFVNIGDVLEQISALNGLEFVTGYETYTCKSTGITTMKVTGLNETSTAKKTLTRSPRGERNDVFIERKILLTPPKFGIHISNGLNTKRIADAASLLAKALL